MSWIKQITPENAQGRLDEIYQRISSGDNPIDNILLAHSLRPHTLEGHMALYKNVLHHNANQMDKHWLEALGVYVSLLNKCDYCVAHHFAGYKRLLKDDERAGQVLLALESNALEKVFSREQVSLFDYARKLTLSPTLVAISDIERMRDAGFDDGMVLEINQVVAYFNYANRTVLGLGVALESSELGLSPNDEEDPANWHHR